MFSPTAFRYVDRIIGAVAGEAVLLFALAVFAFVVIGAIFLWTVDKSLEWLLYDLILGWKR